MTQNSPEQINPAAVEQYVQAASQFMALPLSQARIAAVASHLARTASMAQLLQTQTPTHADDEPAELYCPAPYPQGDQP